MESFWNSFGSWKHVSWDFWRSSTKDIFLYQPCGKLWQPYEWFVMIHGLMPYITYLLNIKCTAYGFYVCLQNVCRQDQVIHSLILWKKERMLSKCRKLYLLDSCYYYWPDKTAIYCWPGYVRTSLILVPIWVHKCFAKSLKLSLNLN